MSRKYTSVDFITKAKDIHGDKYDYSVTNYLGSREKIKIICPAHGMFEQISSNHLAGKGCNRCGEELSAKKQMSTKEEFLTKAKKVHGNKYDYSIIKYHGTEKKVQIKCLKHGIFGQTPASHINGSGCPKCAKNIKFSLEYFKNKARRVHGNKYDYSIVVYENMSTRVKIICPSHGEFYQYPNNHLLGRTCTKCADRVTHTEKEFIHAAIKVHGGNYDYSLVNYINNRTKIEIICKKHGVFKQKPTDHLMGKGCSSCNESGGEKEVARYLNDKNIKYVSQKRFSNCKSKHPLPFDFYLEHDNILIEFDGIQHYEEVSFFGGKEGFKSIKQRDEIKTQFANSENIKLIRIKYDEDVETVLQKHNL